MELYNDDCFEILPEIKDGSVDLVVVDLPYAQTACKWDCLIDLERMWKELKRCCKRDCVYVFFCTTKFGYKLIQSNERWFRYDLVWEKSRKVGFLSANKMPLRKHEMMYVFKEQQGTYNPQKTEGKPYKIKGGKKLSNNMFRNEETSFNRMTINNKGDRHPTSILNIPEAPEDQEERKHDMVYIFSDTNSDDLDNSRNLGLRAYFKNVMEYIGKTLKQITNKVGRSAEHCFYINSTQFSLPTEKTYNKLIEVYELDKMEGFRTLEDLKNEWGEPTYNPQKTEGKPYKTNGREDVGVYSEKGYKGEPINNKGDRHPTSILQIPEAPEDQEERKHQMMYVFKEQQGTYNPQKTEGKPYTDKRTNIIKHAYGDVKRSITENKGDRHPTSILQIPEAPEDQEERKHEMMYVFSDDGVDIDNSRNLGLRAYAKQVKEYINKNIKEIDKAVGNQGIHHFYSFTSTQFSLPTEKTYNKLIEVYELDKMEGFRTLEDLKKEWGEPTYNPQKTEGKPYTDKRKNKIGKKIVYGSNIKRAPQDNKGDRHPTTIVKFNNPKKSLHRTQKPVALCEWLIKSYSNQGDLVLDFTMGSGSTGVACKNTNRKFIGIERDEEIFKTAYERLMD
jgi:DNA modification methylase